jgi:hypothetical protein
MDFTSFVNTFDLFADCYVYGSVAYVVILLVIHLTSAFFDLVDEDQSPSFQPDFYQQVKELLNPSELIDFPAMTIRELRG